MIIIEKELVKAGFENICLIPGTALLQKPDQVNFIFPRQSGIIEDDYLFESSVKVEQTPSFTYKCPRSMERLKQELPLTSKGIGLNSLRARFKFLRTQHLRLQMKMSLAVTICGKCTFIGFNIQQHLPCFVINAQESFAAGSNKYCLRIFFSAVHALLVVSIP